MPSSVSICCPFKVRMEGSDICRLCLQELNNGNSFDIFPQNSEENVIPMRLAAVAAIEVIKFDALPKKICRSCRYQLELSYSFRKKSQIADAKLRKRYKLLSQGKTSDGKTLYFEDEDHEEIIDSLQFMRDFENIRDEDLKKAVRNEVEAEAQELLEKFKVELRVEITKEITNEIRSKEHEAIEKRIYSECLAKAKRELQFGELEELKRQQTKALLGDLEEFLTIKQSERNKADETMVVEELDLGNEATKKVHKDVSETFEKSRKRRENCLETNASQQRMDQLINNHVQQTKASCNTVMSYQIRIKNETLIGKSDQSIDANMEDVAVVNCDELDDDDEISGNQDDEHEILNVFGYESEDPDNTKESHNNYQEIENETEMDEAESPKKSPVITYLCVDSSTKLNAGRSTMTPKIFKCKFCPVEVSTDCSLQRHLRVHANGDKSVACPQCKIVVSCPSALKRHLIIHSGERPYVCGECNKAFGQKEILKRHENTQHKGLRHHKCPHCDRKFSQKINLTEHIQQKHLGEPRKRYKCHLCSKSFFFSSGLSRHLSFHSGITYQCVECVRTFTDRSSIKRHVSKVHGAEKVTKIMTEIDNKNTQK